MTLAIDNCPSKGSFGKCADLIGKAAAQPLDSREASWLSQAGAELERQGKQEAAPWSVGRGAGPWQCRWTHNWGPSMVGVERKGGSNDS